MAVYSEEMAEFEAELKDETDNAWLFVIDGEDVWIPKSQGEWRPHTNKVDGIVEIPIWLAEKKNLA